MDIFNILSEFKNIMIATKTLNKRKIYFRLTSHFPYAENGKNIINKKKKGKSFAKTEILYLA